MKYTILETRENDLLTFRINSSPYPGFTFSVKEYYINEETELGELEYECIAWPRGYLYPNEEESAEIINFVLNDILIKLLKKEKHESVQTSEENE